MIRVARSRNFALRGCTFTIRLPNTYPSRIITAVLIIFRHQLGSGAGLHARRSGDHFRSHQRRNRNLQPRGASGESGVQLIPMVSAPSSFAASMAPST